jgi:hypothetical protein
MQVKGVIDSINFGSESFEYLFNKEDYIIETVKDLAIFNPKRWSETFGKALTKNIIEAKIIHTSMGLVIPLKRYAVKPQRQIIEFTGLYGYNDKSKLLRQLLQELLEQLKNSYIVRIDIAIDFKGKVPNKIIKSLCKHREAFNPNGWNTTYYKTKTEKKTNATIDIKKYNKAKKANLSYELDRLEFVFKGQYLNKLQYKDVSKIFKKMKKSIKKFSGISIKIDSF